MVLNMSLRKAGIAFIKKSEGVMSSAGGVTPFLVDFDPSEQKKNVYRRTFKEDRPHVAEVFLAIIGMVQLR
ncbi:hypothetical protein [Paenibacillus sp. OAE614]|uniref:hypothetical protein n=1 Tax=Paenibacillus sp. OAE614 TaxID=2663804 RepID=UPI0019F47568